MTENHKRRTKVAARRAFATVTSTFSVHTNAAQKKGRTTRAAQLTKFRIAKQIETMKSKIEAGVSQRSGCETSMLVRAGGR